MSILSPQDAADLLLYESVEEMPGKITAIFLPAIDAYIQAATGKDWGVSSPVDPVAQMAAGVLLARWFEDPGMIGKTNDVGVLSLVAQLEAKALQEKQGTDG